VKQPVYRSRIVIVLLVVSLLPLCLVGVGAWVVFGRLLEQKSLEMQRSVVESHARSIEAYLVEHLNLLRLLAESNTLQEIADHNRLSNLFEDLNLSGSGGFVDLGVIDKNGQHLAYVGPYNLLERNYKEADWFEEVLINGVYISDVFLGFRQVPHCIFAIKVENGNNIWILRATINSDQFDALVRTDVLGKTGDAYIVNREGLYQTTPKFGSVLDPSPLSDIEYHRGVRDRKVYVETSVKIQVTTWLNENRWLLVVQQDDSEVRAPIIRATTYGALIILMAVILIVITTFLATRHLTNRIDKANAQREEIYRAFMRSAKLASIGELATGLAHEINNPLAIISADQTNISDIVSDLDIDAKNLDDIKESLERSKKQIQRCKSITTKMLQFGRKRETELEPTDLAKSMQEIIKLLDRQASVRNVELILDFKEDLPSVMVDPVELEQVIVNLFHNSFDAIPFGGKISLALQRKDDEVLLEVKDDGHGIPPENIERIFEPFFTTKPIGKGTGLGLSVCYGIVKSWNGRLEVESFPGKGTVMRIHLPVAENIRQSNT
jgi:two-component system NtrC family sensor kinase